MLINYSVLRLITFLCLSILQIGFYIPTEAQPIENPFANPSFEDGVECPVNVSQIQLVDDWFHVILNSDYYNCGNQEFLGYAETESFASHGSGYVGIATAPFDTSNVEDTECIGQNLPEPLQAGIEYTIKFDAKRPIEGDEETSVGNYTAACKKMCIYGSTEPTPTMVLIDHVSSFEEVTLLGCTDMPVDNTCWQPYSITFTPSQNFEYLYFTLGTEPNNTPLCYQYTFIDNLHTEPTVNEISYCPGNEVVLESPYCEDPNWFNISESPAVDMGSDPEIEITPSGSMEFVATFPGNDSVFYELEPFPAMDFPNVTTVNPDDIGWCNGMIAFDVEPGTTTVINGDTLELPFESLCTGNYTLEIIEDGGCSISETVNLTTGEQIDTVYFCSGEPITLESPFGELTDWFDAAEDGNLIQESTDLTVTPEDGMEILAEELFDTILFVFEESSSSSFPDVSFDLPSSVSTCDGSIDFELGDDELATLDGDTLSPPYENLCEGEYEVMISNGECSDTQLIDLNIDSEVITIEFCEGESVTLETPFESETTWFDSPEGNTELSTSPQLEITPEGNTEIMAVSEGDSAIFELNELAAPQLSSLSTSAPSTPGECNGSIDFELDGETFASLDGSPASPPLNNLCEGEYEIIISNSNCTDTLLIELTAGVINESIEFCAGESLTLESPFGTETTWFGTGDDSGEISSGEELEISPDEDIELLAVSEGDSAVFNLLEHPVPTIPEINITNPTDDEECDGSLDFTLPTGVSATLDGTTAIPPLSGLCEGEYSLVFSNDQCSNSTTFSLTADSGCIEPVPILVEAQDAKCDNSTGSIEVYVDTEVSIEYRLAGATAWQSTPVFEDLPPGSYTVQARNAPGCIGSINVTLKDVNPLDLQVIQSRKVNCPNSNDGMIEVDVTNGTPPYSFELNDRDEQTTGFFDDLAAGAHHLKITDEEGCELTHVFNLDLTFLNAAENCSCQVFIPNAFTPNGDGLNDLWEIEHSCPLKDFHLQVFSRWGHLIFESHDPENPWNGGLRDGPIFSNKGTYVYQVTYRWGNSQEFDTNVHSKTGSVTLIR